MSIAGFIQRTIYLQPKFVVPYACMYAHFMTESKYLKYGFTPYYALNQMKPFLYPQNKLGLKIQPLLMAPGDYWIHNKGYQKVNKFDWKNVEKEYQKAKKFYESEFKNRISGSSEFTYTTTYPEPLEIKKIVGHDREKFKKDFQSFTKRLFSFSKKHDFKVQFDFDWYKPILDFKNKKIISTNPKWDVRFKIPPHLFDFFLKNLPEWGNLLQSYRIKIDIKKGHRQSEYTVQNYFLNANDIPK